MEWAVVSCSKSVTAGKVEDYNDTDNPPPSLSLCDTKGVIHKEFLPEGQPVTSDLHMGAGKVTGLDSKSEATISRGQWGCFCTTVLLLIPPR